MNQKSGFGRLIEKVKTSIRLRRPLILENDELLKKAGVITLSSFSKLPKFSFSGVAYFDDAVVFGEKQFRLHKLAEANNVEEGRFAIAYRLGKKLIVRTDDAGQECIFYYAQGRDWALSTSFLHLVETLRAHGIQLTRNIGPIATGLLKHSSVQHLISNETMANEIRLLPLSHQIEVGPDGFGIIKRSQKEQFTSYEDAIRRFVEKWPRRLSALLHHFGDRSLIGVTGGIDSRVNLALLLSFEKEPNGLNFVSNEQMPNDFAVAKNIASKFQFTIRNKSVANQFCSDDDAYLLWKYASLGVYFPVYWPASKTPHRSIEIHGGGGEVFRQFYKILPDDYAKWIQNNAPESGESASKVFRNGMLEIGAAENTLSSMRDFYRNYRARYHFGRGWFKNLTSTAITPQTDTTLVAAASFLSEDEIARNQIAHDIIALSFPKLLDIPFDSEKKVFSKETRERSRILGLQCNFDQPPVKVYCDPITEGPTAQRNNENLKRLLLRDLGDLPESDEKEAAAAKITAATRITIDAVEGTHLLSRYIIPFNGSH